MAEIVVSVLISSQRNTMRVSRSIDPNTKLEDLQATLLRKAIAEAVGMANGLETAAVALNAAERLASNA